jgi:hypothetical protein
VGDAVGVIRLALRSRRAKGILAGQGGVVMGDPVHDPVLKMHRAAIEQ